MMSEQSYTSPTSRNPWVVSYPPGKTPAQLRLICFPFAGGGAVAFRGWSAQLPSEVEVCAIRLPGREIRLREPLFNRLEPLIEALLDALRPYLHTPFAFFGHSLGGLVSFELARRLQQEHLPGPAHLFVSAHRAPHLPLTAPPVHQAAEAVFIQRLRGFNGTPEAIFQNAELWELMQPILRADFAIWETYRYRSDEPLDCPISAFVGEDDKEVSSDDLEGWRIHTRRAFKLQLMPGDHFYLQNGRSPLFPALAKDLEPYLRRQPVFSAFLE